MCQKDGIFDTFLSHSQDCRKKLKQMKEKGYNTYWYGGEGMGIYDAAGNRLRTTVGRQRVIGPIRPFSLGEGAEPQGDGFVTMPKKRDAPSGASRTIFNKTC